MTGHEHHEWQVDNESAVIQCTVCQLKVNLAMFADPPGCTWVSVGCGRGTRWRVTAMSPTLDKYKIQCTVQNDDLGVAVQEALDMVHRETERSISEALA